MRQKKKNKTGCCGGGGGEETTSSPLSALLSLGRMGVGGGGMGCSFGMPFHTHPQPDLLPTPPPFTPPPAPACVHVPNPHLPTLTYHPSLCLPPYMCHAAHHGSFACPSPHPTTCGLPAICLVAPPCLPPRPIAALLYPPIVGFLSCACV